MVGVSNCVEEAARVTEQLLTEGTMEKEYEAVVTLSKEMTEVAVISTPDHKVNHFVNYWLKQQIRLCAEIGRGAGKGFRDPVSYTHLHT